MKKKLMSQRILMVLLTFSFILTFTVHPIFAQDESEDEIETEEEFDFIEEEIDEIPLGKDPLAHQPEESEEPVEEITEETVVVTTVAYIEEKQEEIVEEKIVFSVYVAPYHFRAVSMKRDRKNVSDSLNFIRF